MEVGNCRYENKKKRKKQLREMPHKTYETKLSPVLGILSRFVKKKD